MIPTIVISLLFILVIVFLVLSAKNWHWSNIVFVILCYIAGVAACLGLAEVLDGRTKALALVKQSEEKLYGLNKDSDDDGIDDMIDADIAGNGPDNDGDGISDNKTAFALESQLKYVTSGSLYSPSYSPDSLRGLNEQRELLLYGRGRVWSNGTPSNDGQNTKFVFAVARPADTETTSLIGTELFAFYERAIDMKKALTGKQTKEDELLDRAKNAIEDSSKAKPEDKDIERLATRFIGSMRVIAESPTELTLEPVFIVDRRLATNISDKTTWTLYEKMPSDRHDILPTLLEGFSPDSSELDDAMISRYRNVLEKFLPADELGYNFFSGNDEIDRAQRIAYEKFIDGFCFDGMSIPRINKWIGNTERRESGDFDPDDEEIFFKYEFTADSDRPFLVDDNGAYPFDKDGNVVANPYTITGATKDKSLHNEGQKDVKFRTGDVVLIDSLNATGYNRPNGDQVVPFAERDDISVKPLDKIFVRKLYNFPHLMKDYRSQAAEFANGTASIQADMKVSQMTSDNLELQVLEREGIITKLEEDRDNLTRDVATIKELLALRTKEAQDLQRRIEQLEAEIRQKRQLGR